MKHASRLFLILVSSCAASGVFAADAAMDYPNRPIRFIAPFVAGGPSDVLSRLLGQKLTEAWGQPVIVDNRGSAGASSASRSRAGATGRIHVAARHLRRADDQPQRL